MGDVGFAMNITGTQIAKDACDIVLLDDNFASIVTAAKWGRNVFDCISKFLQFQLTVNIVAVSMAIVGAFAHSMSPISAPQMLWINLIMDSLASLALATEKPSDSLLDRDPVNASASMVTQQMWYNMIGQSFYQLIVMNILLFKGHVWMGVQEGSAFYNAEHAVSQHYTFIFNAFVMMILFNEINSRKLQGEANVFAGFFENGWFLGVMVATLGLQILAVQFAPFCVTGGLTFMDWVYCVVLGISVLVVQQIINLLRK